MQIRTKYIVLAFVVALIFSQTPIDVFSPLLSASDDWAGAVQARAFRNSVSALTYGSGVTLAQGKFLVADRRIGDPRFSQSVILIVRYSSDGAMGLIINHPTNVELSTVLPDIKGAKGRKDRVYVGGPVGMDQLFLLIRTSGQPEESLHVFGNVYMSVSRKILEGMIEKGRAGEDLRIYVGYAGWAPGQLEAEVSKGDWHVLNADSGTIFAREPAGIWLELINRASAQWVRAWDGQAHFL
jgi:putative transcriptional regulator